MRCADCEHWRLGESYREDKVNWGSCSKAEDYSDYGCPNRIPDDEFGSSDFENYKSWVITGPEFYCKHFTRKNN